MTGPRKRQRKPITVTVDPRMVQFIDMLVAKGIFWSKTAAIDHCMELEKAKHDSMMRRHWWYREVFKQSK